MSHVVLGTTLSSQPFFGRLEGLGILLGTKLDRGLQGKGLVRQFVVSSCREKRQS